jgi:hypothetical protein
MSRSRNNFLRRQSTNRRQLRGGWGMLDMLVAFTLVVATIAVVTPLVMRHGRLLQSQRQYRIALEELSSQLDRLTMLSAAELKSAVRQLQPSDFVAERLPGATLAAQLNEITGGAQQVTLAIAWDTPGRREAPVSLVGWVFPPPENEASEGGQR